MRKFRGLFGNSPAQRSSVRREWRKWLPIGSTAPALCRLLTITVLAVRALAQPGNAEPATNVNSRYTVESVDLAPAVSSGLSKAIRESIRSLVGAPFNQQALDVLVRKIRRELKDRKVALRVSRGSSPGQVKVAIEVSNKERETVQPRLVYHSRQNFTFGVDATFNAGDNAIHVGALTDNDELMERYSGVRAGFRRSELARGRLALGIEIESWRAQWNGATRGALDAQESVPGIYRTRVNVQPSVAIKFHQDLTLQLGVSMQRVQMQFPVARHELSSAAIGTLRFQRRWEFTPHNSHTLETSYGIRSAAPSLASDFSYTRHEFRTAYTWFGHRESIGASVQAGRLSGNAPLFERFVLGNSRTLRGWNKYDVNPLGGDRMVHGSVDGRFRWLRLIYDTGASWNGSGSKQLRHSLAAGIASGAVTEFSLLVAFPIRNGAIQPIFITGLNF